MTSMPYYDAVTEYVKQIKPSSPIHVGTLVKYSHTRYNGTDYGLTFKVDHGVTFPHEGPMGSEVLSTLVRECISESNARGQAPKINVEETVYRVTRYAFDRIISEVSCSMRKRTRVKEQSFLTWLRRQYNIAGAYRGGISTEGKTVESILKLYVWFMSNDKKPNKYEILVNTLKLMKLKEESR